MSRQGESVLVVEDMDVVRTFVVLALEQAGFAVTSAGSLAEALVSIAGSPPTLVLLDLRLPDAAGPPVVERVRAAAPDARVVAMSGTAEQDAVGYTGPARLDGFIQKPIPGAALVARVREHLAAKPR